MADFQVGDTVRMDTPCDRFYTAGALAVLVRPCFDEDNEESKIWLADFGGPQDEGARIRLDEKRGKQWYADQAHMELVLKGANHES